MDSIENTTILLSLIVVILVYYIYVLKQDTTLIRELMYARIDKYRSNQEFFNLQDTTASIQKDG